MVESIEQVGVAWCSSFFGNSAPYAAAIERSVSPNQFNPPPAGFSAQSFSRPRWRVPGELKKAPRIAL